MALQNTVRNTSRSSTIATPPPGIVAIILLSIGLVACTIVDLKKDVARQGETVAAIEGDLKQEEAKHAVFVEEVKKTKTELQQKQVSLDESRARIESLRQQNAIAAVKTDKEKLRRQKIEDELKKVQQCQSEMAELENRSNLSIAEKEQELKTLKDRVNLSMELITTL